MEGCRDFVDYLGPDTSTSVLLCLDDPADLVRASSVSRSWRRFLIANGFCKNLCLRMCPDVSKFSCVMEVNSSQETVEVGSSTGMEWKSLEREHRIYTYLSRCLILPIGERNCILVSISASSTDNDPDETIHNTLEPSDRVNMRPSYWSSKGQSDPEVPETLTYRLCSKLCVVNEIMIQPFEAYFQDDNPIYSAKAVRFRMGHSRLPQERETDSWCADSPVTADDNYVWTYVSPVFPMVQENRLQSFKLPHPVICIGGIVQIELLGRVQKQEMDHLYYICVRHVRVIGRSLSPEFDVDILEGSGNSVLKYFPDAPPSTSPEGASEAEAREPSSGRSLEERIRHLRAGGAWGRGIPSALLDLFLGNVDVPAFDSGSDEEEPVP